jgi:hypothetical protein
VSNSSPHSEDIKRTPSEPAEQPRAETEEDLKKTLAKRREALAELAAYDQEINI